MRSAFHSKQYEIFLEEFRGLRERARISQAELADRLAIGQDIVSRCEAGRRRVDVVELQRWADACGSSLPAFARRLNERMARNRYPEPLRPAPGPKQR